MSAFFNLNGADFAKTGIVFVLASVFATLTQWFNTLGFDFATFQWDELFKVAGMAALTYLSNNLLTTKDGKFGGLV